MAEPLTDKVRAMPSDQALVSDQTRAGIEQRFWSKVDRKGPTDCWPWLAAQYQGYGRFMLNKRVRRAHRVAWELATGEPVPAGEVLCHSCDNPSCVNPAHLWVGSHSENMADAFRKGRYRHQSQTHCRRGHSFAEHGFINSSGFRACRECSRAYTQAWRERQKDTAHG